MNHWGSYVRGRVHEAFARRVGAVDAYREALRAAPAFSRASNRAAYVLAALERLEEAQALFRQTLALEPGNAVAHFNLGIPLPRR